jgi:2-C-methyl-D-erythritol 2,4-cyclodiphosphate synthase
MRIGLGHDIHALVEGRNLIIGGIHIPFEKGLMGHSDADVLVHAMCDALLGAANLGDIGMHFPDNDPACKDISSMKILAEVRNLLSDANYEIVNLDATVFAQAPKLSSFRNPMEISISGVLGISPETVNVKFKTAEHLGFVGEGRGVEASCIALIQKRT